MKRILYGLQDFECLIEDGYLYVDKTPYIFDLISRGKVFFFARPRRFGKSLLVSTLKAIFEGKRDLFNDLAIQKLKTDWQPHPVIHLDFSALDYGSDKILHESLLITLKEIGKKYNIDLSEYSEPGIRFKALIENLSKKTRSSSLSINTTNQFLSISTMFQWQENARLFFGVFTANSTHLMLISNLFLLQASVNFQKHQFFQI